MLTGSLCTFEVAGRRFGLEAGRVREFVRVDRLTPVPRAHSDVVGLLNLRGVIVLAVDAGARLGLRREGSPAATVLERLASPSSGFLDRPIAVVLPSPEGAMALLVDDVHEVIRLDEARFVPHEPDDDLGAALVRGAYRTDNELTAVLDVDAVLAGDAAPPS